MARRQPSAHAAVEPLFQTALGLHEQGQIQRAEQVYREVLRQAPRHAGALNMLGVVGCQSGQLRAGAELIRQALAVEPDNADFHNNLGMALQGLGDAAGALSAFEHAVRHRPRFPEAQFNLANAARAAGDRARAEKHYRKAVRQRPDYVDALNNLGNLLRQRGEVDEAARLLRRVVAVAPELAAAHAGLGLAEQARGDHAAAVASLTRALELAPDDRRAWTALAESHRRLGEPGAAIAALEQALANGAEDASLRDGLGLLRLAQNDLDGARQELLRADQLAGGSATTQSHLGMVAAARGDAAVASEHFERAVDADPACGEAWLNLAELTVERFEDRAAGLAGRVESALAALPAEQGRAELEFADGRLLDRAGDYARAFAAFARANAERRAQVDFDAGAQGRFIDGLVEFFSAARMAQALPGASDSERPVFIVGMPRSGTSLVEQILASHPEVHGGGELTYFPQLVTALPRRLGTRQPFPRCVAGHEAALGGIAGEYLALLAARDADAARVTDKMPYNFLYLGLIALLFPRARVVHCRRDPMATCFSLYTHDLAGAHPYSYDLGDLAAAYRGYDRLMAHWRDALPLTMLEVDYETLVGDVAGGAREMVNFLGLEWHEACLEFHHNRRPVATASQWQVRRPAYTTSRAHWEHYTPYLAPLAEGLGSAPGTAA
ncbi:MAG: tetratricopeptide repeat-containing sulfotransferase family protein [Gammaproteobacteria bacterium]